MSRLALAVALLPTATLADLGPAGHAHPHGTEGALVALLLAGLALGAWRLSR